MSSSLLKIDLHIHTADDPQEAIEHSSTELIDKAQALGFDALSITNHNGICFTQYLCDYARERGIVLIPGVEIDIGRKHVLVINAKQDALDARTFEDLRKMRNHSNLIVAPHPFFPGFSSLLWQVEKNIDIFDALEYSWFYHNYINFNRFAVRLAEKYEKPVLCTSDCHHIEKFGVAYSLVEAQKEPDAIIEAIRLGRLQIEADPLPLLEFARHGIEHVINVSGRNLRRLWDGRE